MGQLIYALERMVVTCLGWSDGDTENCKRNSCEYTFACKIRITHDLASCVIEFGNLPRR